MLDILEHALIITSFVFVMMLLIEYLNVISSGEWLKRVACHTWGQYVFASLLGIIPGCLGPFVIVAMYSHGIVTFGSIVTAMITTSGDEAYIMFAMIPRQAFMLTGVLIVVGIAAGILTDIFTGRSFAGQDKCGQKFEIHAQEHCEFFSLGKIIRQWKTCSPARGILIFAVMLFILALLSGELGPSQWNWVRITFLTLTSIAIFIVTTVPDHFLEEHLWEHIAKKHVPHVFLWTLGAMIVMHLLTEQLHFESTIRENNWIILVMACVVGLIPESGPHLVFTTFYAQGTIPISVLLANSIVQDGHGMLPLLAHSRRTFLKIKAINFATGILVGTFVMITGF